MDYTPIRIQTVPYPGSYFSTRDGTIYLAVKTNPKRCVSRDKSGAQWLVPYGNIVDIVDDQGWDTPEAPKPGETIRIKRTSGMYDRTWFRQYSTSTLFVVTKSDGAKVSFVPLGGKGMPERTTGYNALPQNCEIVHIDLGSIVLI
jgi:hypothetical protein